MIGLFTGLATGLQGIAAKIGMYVMIGAVVFGLGFASAWKVKTGMEAEAIAKAQTAVIQVQAKQAEITSTVESKAEAQQVQIQTVTRTIIKKVPTYIAVKAECPVSRGFVAIHDAAAQGIEPNEPHPGEPSDKSLQDVAQTINENYSACRADQARLQELQSWVLSQQAIMKGN